MVRDPRLIDAISFLARLKSKTGYIRNVREIVRQHLRFFLFAILAAFALRLLFIFFYPAITNDSFIYGDIAKNWLQHGIYGLSGEDISPTYIRLPGYPAFLAVIFTIFGMEHYRAVLVVQTFVDIATCFLIADMAQRIVSDRAAKISFLLAALCPFLANYAAAALTETLEIFFTALALDFAIVGANGLDEGRWRSWLGCGLAVGAAILLRPDGGILLMAIGLYLVWLVEPANPHETLFVSSLACVSGVGSGFARPTGSMDPSQSAYFAEVRTARATVCERRRRIRAHGI